MSLDFSQENGISFDLKDVYILGTCNITVLAIPVTHLVYTNIVPFNNSIPQIDGTTISDAENLDLGMLVSNLKKYSSNYSDMTGSL